ncbi:MAG: carbohydrate binding family 9 domain-containing protein [Acidobacteria bacterium]|nr:carbohydrate binding family 9 domain-containing protein [Acidobacteriota bacterium]
MNPARRPALVLSAAALLCATMAGFASTSQAPAKPARAESARFQVTKALSKIEVDGVLDEEAWAATPAILLPFEWQPGDNIPAPVKTECLVTYDIHNLYIGFRCFDPEPRKIRAHLMDRDDTDTLILDDHISFMVDAFNDERRAFQFRVNPMGVQADAIFSELEGYEDFSWDAIWSAAAKITDWGYAIEVAIPLSQLRFRKSEGPQTWGFSAERSWPRDTRHRMTSHPRSRNVNCILCQFNKLTGFEGIVPGKAIELNPTFTASRTDAMNPEEYPDGSLERGKPDYEPGLTAKWGITPNFILNATANPDFSQVEADVAQFEINRRFALFYPEKRPFFLEGADFFLTPVQAVFTRTVADPLWGTKLTGKSGRTAMGFFGAQDEITNFIFPSNQGSVQGSLDQNAYGGVFRLRQDVGRMSTLGVLYTGRAGSDYYNHVAGADGFLRLDQKSSIIFQFLHSETDYPEAIALAYGQRDTRFGGNAVNLQFQHFSRNWIIQASYEDLSPGFRADYGFVPRVDTRRGEASLFRQIWGKPKSWFNLIRLGAGGEVVYNHDGALTDSGLTLVGMYQGNLETQVNVNGNILRTYYDGRYFDTAFGTANFRIRPFSGSEIGVEGMAGQAIDYANSRPADVFAVGPNASFSLFRRLNLVVSHSFERLSEGGDTIYTANLTQTKLVWNFSVRSFVRVVVQYRDLRQNPAMNIFPVDSRTKGFFAQFLFSYKLNPRTVLFLGYSDNAMGGVFDSWLGSGRVGITRIDRTFFLKIGYAWQI